MSVLMISMTVYFILNSFVLLIILFTWMMEMITKIERGVFCKKQDYWYVVYDGILSKDAYETKTLYQLIFISKDTLSPFHKE